MIRALVILVSLGLVFPAKALVIDVTVAPYNMACNGTDETNKLKRVALDASVAGADVVFPANGSCVFSEPINFTSSWITLRGAGPSSSLIRRGAGGDGIVFTAGPTNDGAYYNGVKSIRILRDDTLASFNGSISGTTLAVNQLTMPPGATSPGSLSVGEEIIGPGVATGTTVTGFLSGTPGGVGQYSISISQNVPSGSLMARGPTTGAGLRLSYQTNFFASDLVILDFYQNLLIEGGGKLHINHTELISGDAWPALVPGSATVSVQPLVIGSRVLSPSGIYFGDPAWGGVKNFPTVQYSLLIGAVDGLYMTNGHLGNSQYDIGIVPSRDGQGITSINLNNNYIDGTNGVGEVGLYIPAMTGSGRVVGNINLTGGTINGHTSAGVLIEHQQAGPISIGGAQIGDQRGYCIHAPSVGVLLIYGNTFVTCQNSHVGMAAGVVVGDNAQAYISSIVGNVFNFYGACLAVSANFKTISGNNYGVCDSDKPSDMISALVTSGSVAVGTNLSAPNGTVSAQQITGNNVTANGTSQSTTASSTAVGAPVAGTSCNGVPSSSFQVLGGIVTHC